MVLEMPSQWDVTASTLKPWQRLRRTRALYFLEEKLKRRTTLSSSQTILGPPKNSKLLVLSWEQEDLISLKLPPYQLFHLSSSVLEKKVLYHMSKSILNLGQVPSLLEIFCASSHESMGHSVLQCSNPLCVPPVGAGLM